MITELTILMPSDMHTHVRQDAALPVLTTLTGKNFRNILVMPNTVPAIETGVQAVQYGGEVQKHTNANIIATIKITTLTTADMILKAINLGINVGKLYFGITTNEAEGARGIEPYLPALRAMEEYGMILCIHGEMAYDANGKKIINLRREEAFIPIAERIVNEFPKLKIVIEHITTKAMADFVLQSPANVAATITVQHLRDDIDAVLGYTTANGEVLNTHAYCKPVLKYPEDREALLAVAISGNPKFFFGSDSAPHPTSAKECCCGKPGVFSAMIRIETLAEIFEEAGALDKLEGFLSVYGPLFYGLPETKEYITLQKSPWIIDSTYVDSYTNYRAGETIQWRVV